MGTDHLLTLGAAKALPWAVAEPVLAMLLFGAVIMLGFALLREISR